MRWYLTKLYTELDERGNTVFKPVVAQYCGNYACIDLRVNTQSVNGVMLAECRPTDAEHQAMLAEANITYIPFEGTNGAELTPESLIGEIPAGKRANLKTALESKGVPLDGITLTDPIKMLVKRIIKRAQIRAILKANDTSDNLDTPVDDLIRQRLSNVSGRAVSDFTDVTLRDVLRKLMPLPWRKELRTHYGN